MVRPAPSLRSVIDHYVGYRYEGFDPGLHRGLPSPRMTFVISLGAPVEMLELPDPAQRPTSMTAFVSGLAASPALLAHDGNQFGIAVELTPLGTRDLFGIPASALADLVVDLSDVMGPTARQLVDRLRAASDWPARFAILDEMLVRSMRRPPTPRPEVVHAWDCLVASEGAIGVGDLADEVGWSRRHLTERFRAELGLAPKVMGRVLRFERSRNLIGVRAARDRDAIRTLADVAAVCGYYDQAHMTRDWNELAGCAPSVWIAEELPSVHDTMVGDAGP